MAHDAYAALFWYQLRQCVRWTEYPYDRYYIFQRRWTQRLVPGSPLIEYRLSLTSTRIVCPMTEWIRQEDLVAWEEHAEQEDSDGDTYDA